MRTVDPILFRHFSAVKIEDFVNEEWMPAQHIESEVEKTWQRLLEENKDNPQGLYDGPMVRTEQIFQRGNQLSIVAMRTDYKHHVATRKNPLLSERANPLYVAALLLTADGYLVTGESLATEKHMVAKINIPAGAVDPNVDRSYSDRSLSLDLALIREINEEIGINAFEHLEANTKALKPSFVVVEEDLQHPSIVYVGQLAIAREEAEQIFKEKVCREAAKGVKQELGLLHFIGASPQAILSEIGRRPDKYHKRVAILLEYAAKENLLQVGN